MYLCQFVCLSLFYGQFVLDPLTVAANVDLTGSRIGPKWSISNGNAPSPISLLKCVSNDSFILTSPTPKFDCKEVLRVLRLKLKSTFLNISKQIFGNELPAPSCGFYVGPKKQRKVLIWYGLSEDFLSKGQNTSGRVAVRHTSQNGL